MGNLNQAIWGPSGNLPINKQWVGILVTAPDTMLTTKYIYEQSTTRRQINLDFSFECVYLNYAILYACQNPVFVDGKLVDADLTRVTTWGTDENMDMLHRDFRANAREWTPTNAGGTKVRTDPDDPNSLIDADISYLFTSWHRINASAPYLQNEIREEHRQRTVSPNTLRYQFDYEDLTGGEERDDDFDDIQMTFSVTS